MFGQVSSGDCGARRRELERKFNRILRVPRGALAQTRHFLHMKILQVNKFFYRRGGAETHFFDVIDLLTTYGHDVIPWSMKDPANSKSDYEKYLDHSFQRF